MAELLRKAGSNWVDGERFYDRQIELDALTERVHEGTHTLLTAQRRMGKTSLVRELLRRLEDEGSHSCVFVDLEGANSAADAVAEIAIRAKPLRSSWRRIAGTFANRLGDAVNRVDELGLSELRVKLRAGIDAGSWQRTGDQVFEALANADRPVVLALDELPILVNRMIHAGEPEDDDAGRRRADEFLSWLRANGQEHRGAVTMIALGSIGLEPVLRQVGLSAQMNIFATFDLRAWDEPAAIGCLGALANQYEIELPLEVRSAMCRRLRCQVPHHVQSYFEHLHQHLRREQRTAATLEDVRAVYQRDLLGVRGQLDLDHYEGRLQTALSGADYGLALDLLTEAAVQEGRLSNEALLQLERDERWLDPAGGDAMERVMRVLQHDGFLEPDGDGYRFVSGLLEDWWLARHGRHHLPFSQR